MWLLCTTQTATYKKSTKFTTPTRVKSNKRKSATKTLAMISKKDHHCHLKHTAPPIYSGSVLLFCSSVQKRIQMGKVDIWCTFPWRWMTDGNGLDSFRRLMSHGGGLVFSCQWITVWEIFWWEMGKLTWKTVPDGSIPTWIDAWKLAIDQQTSAFPVSLSVLSLTVTIREDHPWWFWVLSLTTLAVMENFGWPLDVGKKVTYVVSN